MSTTILTGLISAPPDDDINDLRLSIEASPQIPAAEKPVVLTYFDRIISRDRSPDPLTADEKKRAGLYLQMIIDPKRIKVMDLVMAITDHGLAINDVYYRILSNVIRATIKRMGVVIDANKINDLVQEVMIRVIGRRPGTFVPAFFNRQWRNLIIDCLRLDAINGEDIRHKGKVLFVDFTEEDQI